MDKDDDNLEMNKKKRSSIDLNIPDSKVFSSGVLPENARILNRKICEKHFLKNNEKAKIVSRKGGAKRQKSLVCKKTIIRMKNNSSYHCRVIPSRVIKKELS